jgi:hypothetical protein
MSGLAEHYLDEGRRQMRGYKRKAGGPNSGAAWWAAVLSLLPRIYIRYLS